MHPLDRALTEYTHSAHTSRPSKGAPGETDPITPVLNAFLNSFLDLFLNFRTALSFCLPPDPVPSSGSRPAAPQCHISGQGRTGAGHAAGTGARASGAGGRVLRPAGAARGPGGAAALQFRALHSAGRSVCVRAVSYFTRGAFGRMFVAQLLP